MFPRTILLVGLLAGGLLLPAAGQTFGSDPSIPGAPSTYRISGSYIAKDAGGSAATVNFKNTTGSGTDPYAITPVGINRTTVTLSDGSEVTVTDLCMEMFVGPTGTSTYDVSAGFGSLSSTQEADLRILFSNTLADFLVISPSDYDQKATVGAAIQLAAWEILEEDLFGPGGPYSLDDLALGLGDLSVIDFASGYDGTANDALQLAKSYLDNISSGSWGTDLGGYNYYYADAQGGEQDRLWITPGITTIPEPSTALLGFLGGLILLRRRR